LNIKEYKNNGERDNPEIPSRHFTVLIQDTIYYHEKKGK
jgi:hypothetical protein